MRHAEYFPDMRTDSRQKLQTLSKFRNRVSFSTCNRSKQKQNAKMIILKILLLFIAIAVSSGLRFNKPRILLPIFDEVRVNYTLEVLEKGCFSFR